jgi:DNA-binding CsgD family transcriptional regulator
LTAGEIHYEEIRNEIFSGLDANCFTRKPISDVDLIQRGKDILELKIAGLPSKERSGLFSIE